MQFMMALTALVLAVSVESSAVWGQVRSGVLLAASVASSGAGAGAGDAVATLDRVSARQAPFSQPLLTLGTSKTTPARRDTLSLSLWAALAADAPEEPAMSPSNTGMV